MRVAEYIEHLKTLPQDWHVVTAAHNVCVYQFMNRWTHDWNHLSEAQAYAVSYRVAFNEAMDSYMWDDPWHTTSWGDPRCLKARGDGERDGVLHYLEAQHKANTSLPEADEMIGHRMECIVVSIRQEMRFRDLYAASWYMWCHYPEQDGYEDFGDYMDKEGNRFRRMFIDGQLCYVDTDFIYRIGFRTLKTLQCHWHNPGKITV